MKEGEKILNLLLQKELDSSSDAARIVRRGCVIGN